MTLKKIPAIFIVAFLVSPQINSGSAAGKLNFTRTKYTGSQAKHMSNSFQKKIEEWEKSYPNKCIKLATVISEDQGDNYEFENAIEEISQGDILQPLQNPENLPRSIICAHLYLLAKMGQDEQLEDRTFWNAMHAYTNNFTEDLTGDTPSSDDKVLFTLFSTALTETFLENEKALLESHSAGKIVIEQLVLDAKNKTLDMRSVKKLSCEERSNARDRNRIAKKQKEKTSNKMRKLCEYYKEMKPSQKIKPSISSRELDELFAACPPEFNPSYAAPQMPYFTDELDPNPPSELEPSAPPCF